MRPAQTTAPSAPTSPTALLDFPNATGDGRLRLAFHQPRQILQTCRLDEVLEVIAAAEAAAQQGHWVVGGLSYEAAPAFDAAMASHPGGTWPLAWFAVFEAAAVSPHWPGAGTEAAPQHSPWQASHTAAGHAQDIQHIRAAIRRGEVYQVNHSLSLTASLESQTRSSHAWFLRLREAQPDAYTLWLNLGHDAQGQALELLSLSPELFFRRQGTRLVTRPMKGTVRRGRWAAEDLELAQWLQGSTKNRAENLMIVDLLRNDLARIATPHSVQVDELFALERHPSLWQMTSSISARTRPHTPLAQVFAALFPCGSITGAPKLKAMELIQRLEARPRGFYCGALGLIEPGGDAVFNVAIRTLSRHGRQLTLGVGAGITWDSDAGDEYQESLLKARFVHAAPPAPRADSSADASHSAYTPQPPVLIETLRLEAGRYWLLEGHLQRLGSSAAYFGLAYPAARVTRQLERLASQHPTGLWRVRLELVQAAEPSVHVHIAPFPLTPAHPRIVLAEQPITTTQRWLYHKTSQRQFFETALQTAQQKQADIFDVLLHNERGELTEFTRGNLVVELDGQRYTPPQDSGLLDGVLRRHLIDTGNLQERVLMPVDLARAERLLFINSLRGEIPVALITAWPASRP